MSWRPRARRLLPYLIASASGFLIAYLVVFFFIFPAGLIPDEAAVPDVTGLTYDAAAQRLTQTGFTAARGELRYHVTAPEGIVLAQSPPAGARVVRGAEVTLDLSRGQLTAQVPAVAGLPRHAAELTLQNSGLEVRDVEVREHDAPRGEVIATRPAQGTDLPTRSAVTLIVSEGPATMIMPDVVGQQYAQARVMLEQLGFIPSAPVMDTMSYMLANSVVSQSPSAGDEVPRRSRVTLTIAGTPAP